MKFSYIEENTHSGSVIPQIIHQSWKSKDLSTYADGTLGIESQNSWKRDYPGWKYMFWTDDDITALLNRPENIRWKRIYESLPIRIQQIDFSRYLILYLYGGMYADLDFISNHSIPDHYYKDNSFLGYRARRRPQRAGVHDGEGPEPKWVVGQAWFACHKHYIGLKLMMESLETLDLSFEYSTTKDILYSTGPDAINKVFKENKLAVFAFPMSKIGNWKRRNVKKQKSYWHEMDKHGPPFNAYHTGAAIWHDGAHILTL